MSNNRHHAKLVAEYYAARTAQEERVETYGLGYDAESEDFYATVEPRLTFKDWLIQHARDPDG